MTTTVPRDIAAIVRDVRRLVHVDRILSIETAWFILDTLHISRTMLDAEHGR